MKRKILSVFMAGAVAMALAGCGSTTTKDQEAYRQYGINCINQGAYEDAAEAFQLALNQSKGSVGATELELCYYKAEAYYLSGDVDSAKEVYDAIIDYNRAADAYYLRGCLLMKQGQLEDAVSDFAAAAKKDKKNYELRIEIYRALSANEMEEDGQKYLTEALAINGSKPYDKMEKGRVYALQENYEQAIALLQEAVEGGEVKANLYLAEVYEQTGDTEQANTSFETYLDSGEAERLEIYNMGKSKLEQGDAAQAITYMEEALKMEQGSVPREIYKELAIAYETVYDFSTARSYLEQYVAENPTDEEAQKELLFLETRTD